MKLTDKISLYFHQTKEISEKYLPNNVVTLQFFQRHNDVMLCGINEVIKLLEENTDTSKYTIKYLPEGTIVKNREVCLELEGSYHDFGIWEGIIDGILARQSSIATNAYRIVKAANGKNIVSMADRADHYINQLNDAHAIEVGGIKNHSSFASSNFDASRTYGSMPHALIQMFDGDLVKACEAYHNTFPEDELYALVDFHNDVINDSLACLARFKDELKGVRIDTSKSMIDKMFEQDSNQWGVTPDQVKNLRKALDSHGGKHVKITVSSGFDAKKIAYFESLGAPVDTYGVGEALLKINVHFSADATRLNGKLIAKAGRGYLENKRLIKYSGALNK
ncbi:nicotinic acid phosphoribosyltransferase [Metamycoplasma arthritidis]|uniref:nicotinate phosphoribosyltransferase n=1 Tax=Metamycoplasma arthritidis (strain 158L3-1) TaxID=243272 RepID=B3PNJ4_META1|nr:nicotinate phosphoribosyltransferase [Metamycoplasma arthritidis]ACF07596.1 nicotinate phosphoribosyltransferase [Metamycoplasma arthritidis 158L3-1]VEU79104.1 nicotinic acid phosphoribosyltransferase [Metamycoplasma arthritidis]